MIVILDYHSGNVNSILNMFKRLGVNDVVVSADPEVVRQARKLVLGGVGHFDYGMKQLVQAPYFELLKHKVLNEKTPFLGICLGLQMLTHSSQEGTARGLGWLNADTFLFDAHKMSTPVRLPHFGWTPVVKTKNSALLEGLESFEETRFYFAHSYHVVCKEEIGILECTYGYKFTAAVEQNNILGVQFHPEKSHKFGMKILYNFSVNY